MEFGIFIHLNENHVQLTIWTESRSQIIGFLNVNWIGGCILSEINHHYTSTTSFSTATNEISEFSRLRTCLHCVYTFKV